MPDIVTNKINPQLCFSVVTECLDHLFGLIKSDGRFVYAHQFDNKSWEYGGYNLLRHCGTVWFMCKAIDRLSLDIPPDWERQLSSAVLYVTNQLKPPPWNTGILPSLCLPSRGAVKIGGGGLCLLMLHEFVQLFQNRRIAQHEGSSIPLDIICARLENYLISEMAHGDFIHKRSFSTGEVLPFRSDYYTGEVLFALIKRERTRPRAVDLLSELMDRDYGIAEHSHWMAYAASEALRQQLAHRQKTLGYLVRLISRIIAEPDYRTRHQSTPTACRSEAFLTYLETFNDGGFPAASDHRDLLAPSYTSLVENLNLQLAFYGNGQFKRGSDSDKVQIDYIQHNGASFLGLNLLHSERFGINTSQPYQ